MSKFFKWSNILRNFPVHPITNYVFASSWNKVANHKLKNKQVYNIIILSNCTHKSSAIPSGQDSVFLLGSTLEAYFRLKQSSIYWDEFMQLEHNWKVSFTMYRHLRKSSTVKLRNLPNLVEIVEDKRFLASRNRQKVFVRELILTKTNIELSSIIFESTNMKYGSSNYLGSNVLSPANQKFHVEFHLSTCWHLMKTNKIR